MGRRGWLCISFRSLVASLAVAVFNNSETLIIKMFGWCNANDDGARYSQRGTRSGKFINEVESSESFGSGKKNDFTSSMNCHCES